MKALVLGLLMIGPLTAHADVEDDVEAAIADWPMRDTGKDNPVFAFTNDDAYWSGKDNFGNQPNFMGSKVDVQKLVVATTKDQSVVWFAANVKGVPDAGDCAPGPCPPNRDPPLHTSGLLEKKDKSWSWLAWHVAKGVSAKDQAYYAKTEKNDVLPKDVRTAQDVATLFQTSFADPKALAATVSDRKDVVLYGSEQAERVVGGKQVKAKLKGWNLSFKVDDGIQAGASANGEVAFVAANVDATSLKKKTAAGTFFRVTAIYEKTGDAWKLVLVHFSADTATYVKPK